MVLTPASTSAFFAAGRPTDVHSADPLRAAEKGWTGKGSDAAPPGTASEFDAARGFRERWDDGWSAFHRTVHRVPSLEATARTLRRNARAVVPGLAITAVSGLAFAATLTPKLLAYGVRIHDAAEGLRTVPVVGPLLAQVLGGGGHFGVWGGAACIFSASLALLRGQGDWRHTLWALAHVAQGFATSPFWNMAAAGTLPGVLPGVLLAGACMLGVSLVLGQALQKERPSWLSGVAMTTLSIAGAPLAGALAGGAALPAVAASAGMTLALGALTAAFLLWRSDFAALQDDSTALLRRYAMAPDPTRYLDVPGTPAGKASVFVDDQNLRDKLQSLKINLAAGGKLRLERLLLCGPAGTGKTDVAKSLQNYFDWPFFCVPASLIADNDAPASKITNLMDQAASIAKTTGQPVGLVFDEAEKLFPDRGRARDTGTIRGDAAWSMTATFNDLFEGPSSSKYDQVFTVVITNHPEETDPAFLSRFSGQRRLELALPTADVRRKIFQSRWRTNQRIFPRLARFSGYVPDAATTGRLEAACAPRRHRLRDGGNVDLVLSGRDIDEAVTASLHRANAQFGTDAGGGDQAAFEALLREHFLFAVAKHFEDKARDLAVRASRPPAPTAAPASSFATADAAAALAAVLDGPAGDRLAERFASRLAASSALRTPATHGAADDGPSANGDLEGPGRWPDANGGHGAH